ncbi:MAG: FG-GAP repeat domain-containing protein [Planctomycetota bacterium]
MRFLMPTLGLVAALSPCLAAQDYNNVWVKFEKSPASLVSGTISDQFNETDVIWGDLDKNGWVDVVVVRKEPFTSAGARRNILLMNDAGVLTNETNTYAVASDVGGDTGFNTPTNDRDVQIVDVDGDTWLDVVTATTLSDGLPKHIGHPRVYMNLGEDGGGNWLGLEYQAARIPQLLHYGTGLPENPRFCSVTFGDVNGDGAPDLYFGDYDSSGAGGVAQPANKDLNDRLLINDGNGFFSDQSQVRMSSQMLLSAFGTSVEMADMNLDGTLDVIKDTALFAPQYVAISYNNLLGAAAHGMFNNFDNSGVGSGAPYHIDTGDLNADGRPDIITSDDGLDRYRFNLGLDALGRAEFSGGAGGHTYQFLAGGDDGFGSNNLIVDLDNDGWGDTLHADIDVDIPGGSRRLHIYHNPGSEQGALPGDIVTLREERQRPGAAAGWLGVKGMLEEDLKKTHDVAVFDINNDGWKDMLVSREAGTDVWLNVPPICQTDLGFAGPGDLALSVCGEDLTLSSSQASLEVTGAAPAGTVYLLVGLVNDPVPLLGGTLVPNPYIFAVPVPADGDGEVNLKVAGSGGPPANLYLQAATNDGGTWEFSNALELVIGA